MYYIILMLLECFFLNNTMHFDVEMSDDSTSFEDRRKSPYQLLHSRHRQCLQKMNNSCSSASRKGRDETIWKYEALLESEAKKAKAADHQAMMIKPLCATEKHFLAKPPSGPPPVHLMNACATNRAGTTGAPSTEDRSQNCRTLRVEEW